MTLLTDTPVAGGQAPASAPTTPAPSAGASAAGAAQPATGTKPAASPTTGGASGSALADNGGEAPAATPQETPATPEAPKGPDPKLFGAPETYTFKPSPEGHVVGPQAQSALSEVAKTLNLSQQAAQLLVDKLSPALRAQTANNVKTMVDGWAAEVRADPEIGGDNLSATLTYAKRALDLGPPELRTLLGPPEKGGTGLGNHKAILAWAAAIGKRLAPDSKLVTGYDAKPVARTAEERLAAGYIMPD